MLEIRAGTPLAGQIARAQKALQSSDYPNAAAAYAQAVEALGDDPMHAALRRALWIEHVGLLIRAEQLSEAAGRAGSYITGARQAQDWQAEVELLVLRGEALAAQDDWAACRQVLADVDARLADHPGWAARLGTRAIQLMRLRGLDAAEQGDFDAGRALLLHAAEDFAALDDQHGVRAITNDLLRIDLLAGSAAAVGQVLNQPADEGTDAILLYVRALRRDARYETAARMIERRLEREVDPRLRFPILHELVLLYQTLANNETIARLLPLLDEAAANAADPAAAQAAVQRLRHWRDQGFIATNDTSFEARLHTIRALIQNQALAQAQTALLDLRAAAATQRYIAYWQLVAGELEFALGLHGGKDAAASHGRRAIQHLTFAAHLAWRSSLPYVYMQAIHLIGGVFAQLFDDLSTASSAWAHADRAEELIARRQETDRVRIRYLESLPTQFDELINAAAARVTANSAESVAAVLAAIEAARGAAVLALVLPASAQRLRDLPPPTDPRACWRWYTRIAMALPRDQAIWLIHATPNRVHHGLIGRGLLHWVSVNADRHQLGQAIEELKTCCLSAGQLEHLVQSTPEVLPSHIDAIARMLRLDLVLAALPRHTTRLAIVAGDALGDIPFAALPLPNTGSPRMPLITRYAISDLPCLSAYQPLAHRASASRGDGGLAVRPPAANLVSLARKISVRHMQVLDGAQATITALDTMLATRQFRLLRFDCHGQHAHEQASDSWLELAAGAHDDGRLTVRRFQKLPLNGCGTLILGACESGMAQRLGRDERLGFVRAGLASGAAAVLAARWVAVDAVSAAMLDRFQHYLRYLPRDQALQRAQLEIFERRCALPDAPEQGIPHPNHMARWACWTLFGDAGRQTRANWIRRMTRAWLGRWRVM